MKNTEAAFHWIIGILQKHAIPFQITGGFAARVYGATRELADIDFDIPEEGIEAIIPDVKPYIIYGPTQYKDAHWDLLLLTLSYEGQEIDMSGAYKGKQFDQTTGSWVAAPADLSSPHMQEVYGVTVPVIPKERLISYKKRLGREVDREDVRSLEALS
ncbi:MAG: MazG-related protein [Candidatus Kaiserbacteria bacterium]|nr:MazG-related protein [Candidatus Kaiserbacteria bacterium]